MLSVSGATKSFPTDGEPVGALRGVDLEAAKGLCTAVLGPSGSGKTTLLRVLAGFEQLDAGEVWMEGRLLSGPGHHLLPERRGIGMLAQQGALFPHLDVAANVGFGLNTGPRRFTRAGRRAAGARIAELLELVGLGGYERRRVHELSGGQQQRVALARALAPNPRVVLLDEPFSSLDAALRAELREEVRDLLREVGATVVIVTHDQEEALSLADHVVVMRSGRVAQAGPPAALYEAPGDPGTARFLGDAVVLAARLTEPGDGAAGAARIECALGSIAARDASPAHHDPDGACTAMLRPEQLHFAPEGTVGRVVGASFFGHDTVVRVRLGELGDGPQVLVRTMRERPPRPGESVCLRVEGTAALYPAPAVGDESRSLVRS